MANIMATAKSVGAEVILVVSFLACCWGASYRLAGLRADEAGDKECDEDEDNRGTHDGVSCGKRTSSLRVLWFISRYMCGYEVTNWEKVTTPHMDLGALINHRLCVDAGMISGGAPSARWRRIRGVQMSVVTKCALMSGCLYTILWRHRRLHGQSRVW